MTEAWTRIDAFGMVWGKTQLCVQTAIIQK